MSLHENSLERNLLLVYSARYPYTDVARIALVQRSPHFFEHVTLD